MTILRDEQRSRKTQNNVVSFLRNVSKKETEKRFRIRNPGKKPPPPPPPVSRRMYKKFMEKLNQSGYRGSFQTQGIFFLSLLRIRVP